MNWNDIHDPRGGVEIRATFSASIGQFYTPELIQKLIDQHDVSGMIRIVNGHLQMNGVYNGLMLVEAGEQKALIDYTGTLQTDLD